MTGERTTTTQARETSTAYFIQMAGMVSALSGIWSSDAKFLSSLEVICRSGRELLDADGAYVLVAEAGELQVISAEGYRAEQLRGQRLPLDDASLPAVRVVRERVAQIDNQPNPAGLFDAGRLLLQPILAGERPLGALVFARVAGRPEFGLLESAQADLLARQASFAYLMRRRARELELIYEVTRAINSSLELDEVLEFIYQGISRILPTDNFYIALYDAESDEVRFAIEVEERQRVPKRSRKRAAGLTEYLLETCRPLLIERSFVSTCEQLGIRFGGRASCCWMGAPMVFRDKAIGVIALQSYEQENLFDRDHLSVLENVASQAAVALENARLYQQIRASYEQLQTTQRLLLQSEKLAAVGQLISGIAHELNNPLTGVVGWTQYLMAQPIGETVRRHLTTINEQAERASRIVQNLLTFSRQHKPEQTLVALNEVMESTVALRAYELRVNNIAVHRRYCPDLPVIAADAHQLQQVILNLIINAEQAILSAGRSGNITLATEQGDGAVRVIIADDGPGVPPEMLKRVFDPFFTTKPVGQGTGLGLSISFGIVQEHGGKIWVESEAGQGARFIVELPVTAAEAPAARPREAAPEAGPAGRARVLIVDDEESVRELLIAVLEDQPVEIQTAGTGEEGLAKARASRFDLIITDLKMPGLSGAEFCEKLRELRAPNPPRFLFMTGDVLSAETQQFLASMRSMCMLKPFDILLAKETILAALAAREATGCEPQAASAKPVA